VSQNGPYNVKDIILSNIAVEDHLSGGIHELRKNDHLLKEWSHMDHVASQESAVAEDTSQAHPSNTSSKVRRVHTM
jgi:hypothetical protein